MRTVLSFLVMAVPSFSWPHIGAQECDTDLVFAPDAIVEGEKMEKWVERWWQWIASIPRPTNPQTDLTGEFCDVDQKGPVFFLAATLGGTDAQVLRDRCIAPAGKEIFLPIIPVLAWAPGDCEQDQIEGCFVVAKGFVDGVVDLKFSIDGKEIGCLEDHRHASSVFDFTIPEDNIFSLGEPLMRKGVADGYWLMLKPLSPGKHTISFHADHEGFETEFITYELMVEEAADECTDDRIEPPGAFIAGKRLGEWTAEWWRWVAAIPRDRNPQLDPDGSNCAIDQAGPVFFLPGVLGGVIAPVMRDRCVIPCGKHILIALLNVIAWAPGDCPPEDMQACRVLAAQILDTVDRLELTVDGVPVPCLEDHREVSPAFEFTLPVENIFGLGEPLTRLGVSDGYWVMLRPLTPGKHTVVIDAHLPGFDLPLVTHEITVAPCSDVAFRRGDADGNAVLNLTDAIVVLERLFLGREILVCDDAADADDDGELKLTDPIYTLNHLFRGGPAPSAPGPDVCGADPTDTDELGCDNGC